MTGAFVDFHCHLDIYPDFENLILECESNKIYTLGVTTTPRAWRKNYSLTEHTKYVRSALGLHPQLAAEYKNEVDLFCSLIPECQYIGEIGLDGSREYNSSLGIQTEVLKKILKSSAVNGGRIISLHSRGAASRVVDCLRENSDAGKFILHWFSGSLKELDAAIAIGCWFSVGIPMLTSAKGKEIIRRIPRDKLLTETDGPFAKNGKTSARPKDVISAVKMLSAVWALDTDSTQGQVFSNLKKLLERTQ